MPESALHGQWSSGLTFVLAASGAAVGLGNIWKFPYITGVNGGSAFVLVYLICIALIGLPLLMAEIMLGRHAKCNPVTAMRTTAIESGRSGEWRWLGVLVMAASFIILSYYSVIAGWALDYAVLALQNTFYQCNAADIDRLYTDMIDNPLRLTLSHSAIVLLSGAIVARGVKHGLEQFVRLMFPTIIALLGLLLAYAMQSGHFEHGMRFLFTPDFSKLTGNGIISALGHAFFTLNLATGSIMMYGAYVPNTVSISATALAIATTDTLIALLAGMVIFPIVFANGLPASAGPGLIFKTLPIAFGNMPYGGVFASLFFAMLVFAALTSAISLIEPLVAWGIECRSMSRQEATWRCIFYIWLLGLGSVFSFNLMAEWRILGLNCFELLDMISANLMLPLGGLLTAVFVGWHMSFAILRDELGVQHRERLRNWYICIRYVVPAGISIVMLSFFGYLPW